MDSLFSVNYPAVLGAAVVSMVIGFLWYGPVFGKVWLEETGLSKKKIETANKKWMGKGYLLMFVGSLAMAFVLSHATRFASSYLGVTGVPAGLMSGFANWLGFVAPVTLGSIIFEGKSWKLWTLNNGYYLVTLMAMGVVVAYWL